MAAFDHAFAEASEYDRRHGCRRCKGRDDERPRVQVIATYRYVAGRSGRVTSSRVGMCWQHAAAFAERYGLEVPAEAPGGAS